MPLRGVPNDVNSGDICSIKVAGQSLLLGGVFTGEYPKVSS